MNLAKAKKFETKDATPITRQEPFKIPDPVGDYQDYICGIKQESLFEYYSLGGVNFCKFMRPVAAGEARAETITFQNTILTILS